MGFGPRLTAIYTLASPTAGPSHMRSMDSPLVVSSSILQAGQANADTNRSYCSRTRAVGQTSFVNVSVPSRRPSSGQTL